MRIVIQRVSHASVTINQQEKSSIGTGLEFNSPTMDCSKLYFASFSIENSENRQEKFQVRAQ